MRYLHYQLKQPHYQVAISGGGIAGLTLALIFEKLGISYVLFEARSTLESQEGAGVGLQPNGTRILDQLGLLEDIENCTIPLSTWFSLEADGTLISDSAAMGQYLDKIGYSVSFIERRKLIRIMAEHVKDKTSIYTSSRVASIKEFDDYVEVITENGLSVTADLVLGGDGVRSCVRSFIDASQGAKQVMKDQQDISCSFSTVYGMSTATEGIEPGERFAVYREKENLIGFTGKDVVFWFVFAHLDRKYPLSETPRFTEEDSRALCESMADIKVTPSLRFGDLYANKTASLMVPVEEGIASHWHTSRVAILGDAACKMTPAGGQGANQAVESCAVLVNELQKAWKQSGNGHLPRETMRGVLERYTQQRQQTAQTQLQRSQMVIEALFCYPGPASGFRKALSSMSDEAWLERAFTALADSPILDAFELSERGKLYSRTCQAVKEVQALRDQQNAAAAPLKDGSAAQAILTTRQEQSWLHRAAVSAATWATSTLNGALPFRLV